jgi:hypothetical protein
LLSGNYGVIYAILPNGELRWYRHDGYRDGSQHWDKTSVVGSGWQNFRDVFGGHYGVLYAIETSGKLLWYRHKGYTNGNGQWVGRRQVGHGWHAFKDVVSSPETLDVALGVPTLEAGPGQPHLLAAPVLPIIWEVVKRIIIEAIKTDEIGMDPGEQEERDRRREAERKELERQRQLELESGGIEDTEHTTDGPAHPPRADRLDRDRDGNVVGGEIHDAPRRDVDDAGTIA